MLQFGLRLGEQPRQVVTTTPRPTPLLKRLLADPAVAVTARRPRANAAQSCAGLSASDSSTAMRGTRLGRQELDGETDRGPRGRAVDARHARGGDAAGRRRPRAASSWRSIRRPSRGARPTPAASSPPGSTATGSVHRAGRRHRDARRGRRTGRARRSRCYHRLRGRLHRGRGEPGRRDGDGGDQRSRRRPCRCAQVRATRGKWTCAPSRWRCSTSRAGCATPARFPALEDEMCAFGAGRPRGGRCPTGSTRWSGR